MIIKLRQTGLDHLGLRETLNDAINWSGDMNKFIAITANELEASKYNFKHIIKFDKEYNRIYSDGFKFEHKEEPFFSNESDYFNFHNSKGELAIARSMAILNPEKYFKKHFKLRYY